MTTLSNEAVKALMTATTSADIGNEIATAINDGLAIAAQASYVLADLIVAQNVSLSTDFGSLLAGDIVLQFGDTAGTGLFHVIADDGELPAIATAAVVDDLYVVFRPYSAPTATSATF